MAKKWPGMVVQRAFMKGHSFVYRLYIHCKPIPVMKTGFSLCTFSHREKPVSISWDPCNENRFFPVGKKYTGKSLFWPCTDPVRDCSVGSQISRFCFCNMTLILFIIIHLNLCSKKVFSVLNNMIS